LRPQPKKWPKCLSEPELELLDELDEELEELEELEVELTLLERERPVFSFDSC